MICGRPQGVGSLSDADGKIYYQGDFLKGKIHSENATLCRQISGGKNIPALPLDPSKFHGQSKSTFSVGGEKDLLFKGKVILGRREGLGK